MEAQWVAERIAALLGTAYQKHPNEPVRGLTPADFAILMRSTKSEEQDGKPRHHAFSKAVLERGIDFTLSAGGSVFDRQAVSCLREVFAALERGPVNRDAADGLIASHVRAAFPRVNVKRFYSVLADWGRRIHQPSGGARQRLFPQGLLMDLLEAFDLAGSDFDDDVMRDIGLFSRILQDVESVYFSVDSTYRFRSVVRFLQQSAEKGYDVSTDDVVSRPNAVTISTVHQVKGLEFPVVFVVDAVSGRFPGKQTAFESALPHDLLAAAIGRGAYANSVAAEARLFYTALTRAERYLYVTGAALLPNGKQQRRQSKFAAALKDHEICHDPAQLPSNLLKVRQQQSVDEAILPTSFSDIKYYLNCPMDYRFRKGYGFSPPVPELFGYGRVVHVAIEKLHQAFQERVPSAEEVTTLTSDNFHLKHVAPSGDPVNRPGAYENAKKKAISIAQDYVQRFKADFAQLRQVEVRFEIAARDCIITGSIDLIMRCDANGDLVEAHVVDFKTMEGGENPLENQKLDWRTLSLQVQLYAHATREVYGQRAEMGSIHLLKDNKRISVPIDEASVRSAMENVEWAVRGILEQDFPMRPSPSKCRECDFRRICPQEVQQFRFEGQPPPPISTPLGTAMAAAFDIGDSAVCEVARAC
jgi:DNA helicase II / ATP-dependent DNA helicase PcrA